MRPGIRERTVRLRARVCKRAMRIGPAGRLRRAEFLFAVDLRMLAVFPVKSHAARGDVTARPACRHAQQLGVEQHACAIADTNGQALQGDVVAGEPSADARALKREILLQQPGTIRAAAT